MKAPFIEVAACVALAAAFAANAAEPAPADDTAATVKQDARTAGHAIADGARTVGHEIGDKSRETGHVIAEKSRETGHVIADKSREAGHAFADAAHHFAKTVAASAQKVKAAVKHDDAEPAPKN